MGITKGQAKSAFLQAADCIEAAPELYSFYSVEVGEAGDIACMWGHVGRVLGLAAAVCISDVAKLFQLNTLSLYYSEYGGGFDHPETNRGFDNDPIMAANRLRAFAEFTYPES